MLYAPKPRDIAAVLAAGVRERQRLDTVAARASKPPTTSALFLRPSLVDTGVLLDQLGIDELAVLVATSPCASVPNLNATSKQINAAFSLPEFWLSSVQAGQHDCTMCGY